MIGSLKFPTDKVKQSHKSLKVQNNSCDHLNLEKFQFQTQFYHYLFILVEYIFCVLSFKLFLFYKKAKIYLQRHLQELLHSRYRIKSLFIIFLAFEMVLGAQKLGILLYEKHQQVSYFYFICILIIIIWQLATHFN